MFRNILLVFENETICAEAVTYAREFALRMDCQVTFLMLVPMAFIGKTLLGSKRNALHQIESRVAKQLSACSENFIQHGIEVTSALRVGEPAQEMLKFLADRPPFHAVVWGSSQELPAKGHWINRIAGTLECPLLTVSRKPAS